MELPFRMKKIAFMLLAICFKQQIKKGLKSSLFSMSTCTLTCGCGRRIRTLTK